MTWQRPKLGAISIVMQLIAIVMYGILVMHENADVTWTSIKPLNAADKGLLRLSIRLVEASALVSMLGIVIDHKRLLAILSLAVIIPILTLMAGFQGIW
jgi:hypothetical protein